jgi:hypothetical protein
MLVDISSYAEESKQSIWDVTLNISKEDTKGVENKEETKSNKSDDGDYSWVSLLLIIRLMDLWII